VRELVDQTGVEPVTS